MDDHQFLAIIDATPLVSIDLVIINNRDEVLLGRRTNRPARGWWFVPGGRIRKNEQLVDAFIRIARSELGISAELTEATLLGAFDHIYDDNYLGKAGINTHYVVLGYLLRLDRHTPMTNDDQHAEIKWWPVDDILKNPQVHENTLRYFSTDVLIRERKRLQNTSETGSR